MVGGLVENEEVDRLEQQAYHGQTGLLAARKHFNLLVGGFAAKHECAEDVAYAGADGAGGNAVDSVEHRYILIEQLGLILGEIANFYIVSDFQGAGERYFVHYALHQGGLAFAVLAYKRHFFTALDGKCGMIKHKVLAVGFAHIVGNHRVVARTRSGRKTQIQPRIIYLIDLDTLYFRKLLHAALHLYGLGCFISESFDECLSVGNFFLLVLVGSHLLGDALLAQFHEF